MDAAEVKGLTTSLLSFCGRKVGRTHHNGKSREEYQQGLLAHLQVLVSASKYFLFQLENGVARIGPTPQLFGLSVC